MKKPDAKHLCSFFFVLAGLTAVGFAIWSLHQATRPGRVHYERGLDAAVAKQIPQAEQEWLAGTREDPNFPDNYAQLGDLYSAQGRFSEAAAQYQSAARLTPQDATIFQRLTKAEDSSGDQKSALDAASHAAALRPENAAIVADCGIRAAKLNEPKLALRALKRAYALTPDNANVLIYLIRVEFQLRDSAGVERDLTPFLQSHPENAEACYLMASLLHQKPMTTANSQAAIDYARRAAAGAPTNPEAQVLFGQVLLDAKQPAQALSAFQKAQVLLPSSILALHGLLTCYTLLGQPRQATQTRTALNIVLARQIQMGHAADLLLENPGNTMAALQMAHLREENGELDLAESYYRRAVRHAPQDSQARAALNEFLKRIAKRN